MSRRRALSLVAAGSVLGAAWIRCGPLPPGLLDPARFVSTEFVDRHGEPLYESPSRAGDRARFLAAAELPETLVRATLAAEDRRFFRHPGIDPLAIARALLHDLRAGRLVEGGSTLTQQTVKLLRGGSRPPGLLPKLEEAVLALRLEHRLGKREVLALYLNLAPYGNQARGAEAASRAYFGCAAANLTPAQAAFLAGLPQRPSARNPRREMEGARARQRTVLRRMAASGWLDAGEAQRAQDERLALVEQRRPFLAPHFVSRVRASLGSARARRVVTTLDAGLQRELQGILRMHRQRLREAGAAHVAVAVLRNESAEWLAWEGSGAHDEDEQEGRIDGVVSPRQPGSALKPFTYALAFDRGYTPASVLPDVPSHFETALPGILYSPRNYDGVFRGPLRAREALAGSENVPAVALLERLSVESLARLLRRVGLRTLDKSGDHYGLALTMGDAEVRLDELVAAYATLARGGVYRVPRLVLSVAGPDAAAVVTAARAGTGAAAGAPARSVEADEEARVISERAAFWVADVLADAGARAYVFGRGGSLELPFAAAAKTGTSTAYRDNWTLGFTRDVSVGVWVGNFDRKELRRSSGVTGAAPIFHDVMLAAVARYGRSGAGADELLPRPEGLRARHVCALSGLLATEACPRQETEWLEASRRLPACSWHVGRGARAVVRWPQPYRAWARERGLLDERRAPAGAAAVTRSSASRTADAAGSVAAAAPEGGTLRITNPPAGATYLVDPTLRSEYQTLPLRAQGALSRVTWFVDGREWGNAAPDAPVHWPLRPGAHTLVASDGAGREASASILVK